MSVTLFAQQQTTDGDIIAINNDNLKTTEDFFNHLCEMDNIQTIYLVKDKKSSKLITTYKTNKCNEEAMSRYADKFQTNSKIRSIIMKKQSDGFEYALIDNDGSMVLETKSGDVPKELKKNIRQNIHSTPEEKKQPICQEYIVCIKNQDTREKERYNVITIDKVLRCLDKSLSKYSQFVARANVRSKQKYIIISTCINGNPKSRNTMPQCDDIMCIKLITKIISSFMDGTLCNDVLFVKWFKRMHGNQYKILFGFELTNKNIRTHSITLGNNIDKLCAIQLKLVVEDKPDEVEFPQIPNDFNKLGKTRGYSEYLQSLITSGQELKKTWKKNTADEVMNKIVSILNKANIDDQEKLSNLATELNGLRCVYADAKKYSDAILKIIIQTVIKMSGDFSNAVKTFCKPGLAIAMLLRKWRPRELEIEGMNGNIVVHMLIEDVCAKLMNIDVVKFVTVIHRIKQIKNMLNDSLALHSDINDIIIEYVIDSLLESTTIQNELNSMILIIVALKSQNMITKEMVNNVIISLLNTFKKHSSSDSIYNCCISSLHIMVHAIRTMYELSGKELPDKKLIIVKDGKKISITKELRSIDIRKLQSKIRFEVKDTIEWLDKFSVEIQPDEIPGKVLDNKKLIKSKLVTKSSSVAPIVPKSKQKSVIKKSVSFVRSNMYNELNENHNSSPRSVSSQGESFGASEQSRYHQEYSPEHQDNSFGASEQSGYHQEYSPEHQDNSYYYNASFGASEQSGYHQEYSPEHQDNSYCYNASSRSSDSGGFTQVRHKQWKRK
jgi:hypothetical protein